MVEVKEFITLGKLSWCGWEWVRICDKNCAKNCAKKNCEKSPPISGKMEHLIVRFQNHLPYLVERMGDRSMSFPIPKRKRLKTLQFMNKHPQHIIRKRKSSWEVIGTIPLKQRDGQYNYRSFYQWLEESFWLEYLTTNWADHLLLSFRKILASRVCTSATSRTTQNSSILDPLWMWCHPRYLGMTTTPEQ